MCKNEPVAPSDPHTAFQKSTLPRTPQNSCSVVHVGRSTDQPLGVRLRQHTADRLNGRWDRFSWFGIHPISENGTLLKNSSTQYGIDMLIVTMEALLIEGLEPPQNRKRGDDFRAAEFQQTEDPEIGKARIRLLLEEIQRKM